MTANASTYLDQLKSSDPTVRRRAVRHLGMFPQANVVAAMGEALGDSNKGVQNTALETLCEMRHPDVITGLLPVIRGSDLNMRNAGMTILKTFGPMAVAPLIDAIKQATDVDEIIQILVVLGNVGSPLATDIVMSYVAHEDDNVKTTAVEALGKIQDPQAVKLLINTYHQTDILKYSIVEALGNIAVKDVQPVVMGSLESEDVLEYFSGIGAIGAMEDEAGLEPLFRKMISEEDGGTRRLIMKSMAQIEEANPGCLRKLDQAKLKEILLPLLEQQDSAEYVHLVRIAASLDHVDYASALLSALKNSEAEIVQVAVDGLNRLGTQIVKPALDVIGKVPPAVAIDILTILQKHPDSRTSAGIAALAQNPDDGVRQAVARTLGANPSELSFKTLKTLLNDIDETVRRFSVVGLRSMLEYDGALTALVDRLKDMNGHVRREAALALGQSNSPQIEGPLFSVITNEPYGDVREGAAIALASRRDPKITKRLLEFLDSDNSRVRETIARTIWQCGSTHAVDTLITKLSDSEWRVAVNACYSLEKMKDLKSIFPLKELLKHDDWQIRIAALSALRAFQSKELKQFFIPLIGDQNPHVAKLAVVALSELEDKSLDDAFRKHLDHPRWEVRYQIVKALGKIRSQKAGDALVKIAQNDPNNGVRAKAILALARILTPDASKAALALLEHEDRDLVVAAIKFFLQFENPAVENLEETLKRVFLSNPWVKAYFLQTVNENHCPLLDRILNAVAAPRELRRVALMREQKIAEGINSEEALLLREIIAERCGIELKDRFTLQSRLQKNLARFYITTWMEYYHALRYGSDEQNLLISLYDSITDPATEFFSEPAQNKVLVNTVIPELIEERVKAGSSTLRILSCGCSFGPEAYSLAMSILEDVHSDQVSVSVTGVDISNICLNTGKRGIYKREMLRAVDQKYLDLYFEDDRGDLRVRDEVKNMVEFKYLNLSSTNEMEELGLYDVVICRSVFQDFSQRQKSRLAENIYNVLAPGGALFIASRESLYNVTKAFRLQTHDKVVVYRKL